MFQHSVLIVQDIKSIQYSYETHVASSYFQNFEIYIGDSSNYTWNSKCAGGPFLEDTDTVLVGSTS